MKDISDIKQIFLKDIQMLRLSICMQINKMQVIQNKKMNIYYKEFECLLQSLVMTEILPG